MAAVDVARYSAAAPAAARSHLQDYLRTYGIDADRLADALARQLPAKARMYFVSSIVRGLGGPTSDIDLIVVHPGGEPAVQMSTMLFAEGQRVGIKFVTEGDLDRAADALLTLAIAPTILPERVNSWNAAQGISWIDLERLINGFAPEHGMAYLSLLPALSAVTQKAAALEALYLGRLAALCLRAGLLRGALGYGWGALIAAMNAMMASCGDVLVAQKWVLERWRRFALLESTRSSELAEVDAIRAMLARAKADSASFEPAALLALADTLVTQASAHPRTEAAFALPADFTARPFFGTAAVATHDGRLVMLDTRLLALASAPWSTLAMAKAADAERLVTLAQDGLLLPRAEIAA